jgi:hypothetical protein
MKSERKLEHHAFVCAAGIGFSKIPAACGACFLTQQDYNVMLKGKTAAGQTETIGEYYFRV